MFTYAPLWQTLKDKGISQYELIKTYHISTGTLDALRKNKSVTMNTLHDICVILDCPIEAVVKIEKGDEYYGAAEPPVRCGESHLSGLTEPPQFVY